MSKIQKYLVHGISLSITSHDAAYQQAAQNYFIGFERLTAEASDITVSVTTSEQFSKNKNQAYTPQTLGRGIGWDGQNNTVYILEGEFETRITLSAPWYCEIGISSTVRLFHRPNNTAAFEKVNTFIRNLICMQLALRWNVTALSATAFKLGGPQAHVVAGISTEDTNMLIRALQKELGAEILSRDIVLTDGERLFPFPQAQCSTLTPQAIGNLFILTSGDKCTHYELPREQAYHALCAVNNLKNELPEYGPFAALTLVDPTRWQFLFDHDHETLKKLCEKHTCIRLGADRTLEATLEYFKTIQS